ncbi:hypothetical protein LEN26_014498 [Aphanomyces euteiches]|uniref:Transmembrane 9 superfamily member n=1 Tax=Aphanomyces euteiches TaxID=100861 RepID=A0A6G0WBH8_9STRA|nr:hypothetical protein Ae201684_016675 [Aphanomyces euteiches]KAH9083169.1 hypothetical protein Ae201684P_014066 [Aphanomyces euteiches]KAH9106751.1 hypothetical protein LEN26_014498 [Aphanomyces euteiches]KAH9115451.1 hypothetical protein AeMF1_010504 [Aphanomyces euteiches]KAH9155341.1 hypothetical protein AeRB84_002679 [Aphanomyces euteiches]
MIGGSMLRLAWSALVANLAAGFYLPGVQMVTYKRGDDVPLFVNSLTSPETLLPIDYYNLPFCTPKEIEYKSENLGEYLTANRIENSPYVLKFLEPKHCVVLCSTTYNQKQVHKFATMVKEKYRVNWIVDNMPVSLKYDDIQELGFPLGIFDKEIDKTPRLNNHVKIRIFYNNADDFSAPNPDEGRIVDFVVAPESYDYKPKNRVTGEEPERMDVCEPATNEPKDLYLLETPDKDLSVTWTYSVEWIEDNERTWRTRWDVFFEVGSGSDEVHWFSIINALLIVLFLSGMVGMILMRSLHRDISRYNRVPTEEERMEEREESGWKLVHADVFRPPTTQPMLFCVMIGTGFQLLGMSIITLLFAAIGFLAPSNRGKLMIALLICFVLMGMVAGYASSRMYKMFKGKRWQLNTILTSTLFPGLMFATFFLLNLFVWGAGSDAAVPFGSMMVLVVMWFCVSVPLVFLGAFYGFRQPAVEFPVATSNIPRPIPLQPWYMTNFMTAAVGGILPFGAIFVELFFVLTSIWTDRYYYVYGFLLLSFLILIGTCMEITIVLTYFQLCGEDYNWWWRSFIVSGACGAYVMLYSTYYYWTRLDVENIIGSMLYFGYMSIISGALSLLCGTVGVMASLWFTKKIYASIKVD